jgi:ribosomal protein L11 methylase PrmA
MDDQEKRDRFLAIVQNILAGVLTFALIFGIMIVW